MTYKKAVGSTTAFFMPKLGQKWAFFDALLPCTLPLEMHFPPKKVIVNDKTKGTDQYVKCNATFRDKTATYASSDENIATVGTDGKITVVGTGEVTFTVTLGTETATVKKTF